MHEEIKKDENSEEIDEEEVKPKKKVKTKQGFGNCF